MTFEPRVFGRWSVSDQSLAQNLAPFITRAHDPGCSFRRHGSPCVGLAHAARRNGCGRGTGTRSVLGSPWVWRAARAFSPRATRSCGRCLPDHRSLVDVHGKRAYRMALATRERTSAGRRRRPYLQRAGVLANMAAMYAVYHGPKGLKSIAGRVHTLTRILEDQLGALGVTQGNAQYFDTLRLEVPFGTDAVRRRAVEARINFRYIDDKTIGISLNETVTTADVEDIVTVFAEAAGKPAPEIEWVREVWSCWLAGGGTPRTRS